MRLICPNCGAQYEVEARVIPDGGRDVQCSNCGHTWFQKPEHMDEELAEEMGYEVSSPSGDEGETDTPPPEVPEFEDETEVGAPPSVEAPDLEESSDASIEGSVAEMVASGNYLDDGKLDDDDFEDDAPASQRPQRESNLSESVRDILRSEVEFDQSQRGETAQSLETQPDLGIDTPAPDSAEKSLRDRMARLRGLDPADSGGTSKLAATMGKRRDLLPDIEEIKSTLSASSERDEDGSVPDASTRKKRSQRSGMRTSFLVIILLVLLAIALYLLAPVLAAAFPALSPVLEGYVGAANTIRDLLDTVLSGASERLNGLLGQISG